MPSDLGAFIRKRRQDLGIGLREFARRIKRSAPYLTQLELDDDPPPASQNTLLAMAKELDVSADLLFALANRLPRELTPRTQLEVALYRKVKGMSIAQQEQLLEQQPTRRRRK